MYREAGEQGSRALTAKHRGSAAATSGPFRRVGVPAEAC